MLSPCEHKNHRRESGEVLEQNKSWFLTSDASVLTKAMLERRMDKISGNVPKRTRALASQVINASIPPQTLIKWFPFFSMTSIFRRAGWVNRIDPRLLAVGHRFLVDWGNRYARCGKKGRLFH